MLTCINWLHCSRTAIPSCTYINRISHTKAGSIHISYTPNRCKFNISPHFWIVFFFSYGFTIYRSPMFWRPPLPQPSECRSLRPLPQSVDLPKCEEAIYACMARDRRESGNTCTAKIHVLDLEQIHDLYSSNFGQFSCCHAWYKCCITYHFSDFSAWSFILKKIIWYIFPFFLHYIYIYLYQ